MEDNKDKKAIPAIYFDEDLKEGKEVFKEITDDVIPTVPPNTYFASSHGNIYSRETKSMVYQHKYKQKNGKNGYLNVHLKHSKNVKATPLSHRIILKTFEPNENSDKLQVNHKDGNKQNNRLDNLEWVTPSENIIHAYQTGLKSVKHCGESPNAIITNEQARKIAELVIEQKLSNREIAEMVGCNVDMVWRIVQGAEWTDIHNEYELWKYKRDPRPGFSDEELEKICKYFEDHASEYIVRADLYRAAMMDLFGIEYTNNMSANMCRIYNHNTRKDITDKYNF